MSHVYFIQAGWSREEAWIKIGHAKHPRKRLANMQVGCPLDLHLIAAIEFGDYAPDVEQRLHKTFKSLRRPRSEWFRSHPQIFALVRRLERFKFDPGQWRQVEDLDLAPFNAVAAHSHDQHWPIWNNEEHW